MTALFFDREPIATRLPFGYNEHDSYDAQKEEETTMKKSEVIAANYDDLVRTMTEKYRSVLVSGGAIEHPIYIWDDGTIDCKEVIQGSTSYWIPPEYETRQLFYVVTVSAPHFDAWDYADHPCPDDPDEADAELAENIDWLVDEYPETARETLNAVIADAEKEENN